MVPPSSYLCPWFNFDCSTCFAGVQSAQRAEARSKATIHRPPHQHVSRRAPSGARRKDRIAPYPARASAALSCASAEGSRPPTQPMIPVRHHVSCGIAACLAALRVISRNPPVQLALVMGTSRRAVLRELVRPAMRARDVGNTCIDDDRVGRSVGR